jgi:protein-S-isoprenylcysteine O-methyltransferase Ste14
MTDTTNILPENDRRRDSAGVVAAPPLLFGAALVVGFSLRAIHPIRIASIPGDMLRVAGGALIMVGVAVSIAVVLAFARAGTHVSPYRETTRLVCTGPYRYTRNPDYVGQTFLYAGIAIVANTWWPLFLLPIVLLAVDRGVVRREERYLEAKFGQEYRDYTARVPRWF